MARKRWRSGVVATGGRVAICVLGRADEAEFVAAAQRSARLHGRWAFPPTDPTSFRAYLARMHGTEDTGLLARLAGTGEPAGFLNLSNVVRGALQSAQLGYAAFVPHNGRGLMSEALRLLYGYAFEDLGLHRLEAAIQPANEASIRLATACGMALEGYSRRYLYLAGRWRDHLRYAITAEDWERTRGPRPR